MRKKSLLKRIFTKRRMRKIKTSLIRFKKKNLALVSGKIGVSKGVAISLSVLILAAAVAGINWAKFQDVETSEGNTLSAGTLDLEKTKDVPFSVSDLKPGDNGDRTITVTNSGSIDGVLKVTSVEIKENNENTCGDPEIENGDTCNQQNDNGDLPEYLIITIGNTDDEDLFANGYLASLANGVGLTGANVDLPANANTDIVVKYSVPEDTGNIIQSDSCDFTITFTLEQKKQE